MEKRQEQNIECIVEFTEGAIDRITDAFVDLHYQIKQGIYRGPQLPETEQGETA